MFRQYQLIGFVILIGIIGYTYVTMKNEISEGKLKALTYEQTINTKDIIITTLQQSTSDLYSEIVTLSSAYDKFKKTAKANKSRYDAWKKKSSDYKYRVTTVSTNPNNLDLDTATCKQGIVYNKKISELRYEDL